MYLITVAVVTSCAVLVFGQYPPCFTTDGKRKECVPVAQCELLSILARKSEKSDSDLAVLRRSFCGWKEQEPTVCCPEIPIPKPDRRINESPGVCSTPDGKQGECISLLSCPYLIKILTPPIPDENVDYLNKSRCNGTEKYHVCCPLPQLERSGEEHADEPGSCPDLMTAFPPARDTQCCGETIGTNNKIIGGNATYIDEYPWAVLIEYKILLSGRTAFQCGGALISGKYVLTAAHCITGRILQTAIPTTVVLGEYDTDNDGQDCITAPGGGTDCTDGEKKIRIEKTIPHPDYIKSQSIRNDIGLIRMRERAPYTDFIRPICLPSKDLTKPENTPLYFSLNAVGWGATENAISSNIKIDVSLPFVDREKCQSLIGSAGMNLRLWKGQLCAGGVKDADTCKGDSGGPLVYEDEVYGTFELVGLVSFGRTYCGEKNVPGIYTNVYEYLDWIKSNIVA